MTTDRAWLASLLQCVPRELPVPLGDAGQLLTAAEEEGVTALVAAVRLTPEVSGAFLGRVRALAASYLLREQEFRRIFALLVENDIRPLLLKGSALAFWLYPAPYLRETGDLDLLFESADQARRAAVILEGQGYAGGKYYGALAHEVTLRKVYSGQSSAHIDLHWQLFNHPAFVEVLPTALLFEKAFPVPAFHPEARGLDPAHATVHACVHRAMNLHMGIGDRLKWLYDLNLLAQHLGADGWREIVDICNRHHISAVCLDAFDKTCVTFGTEVPMEVMLDLRRHASAEGIDSRRLDDWRYMQRLAFWRVPSLAGKMRWLLRKVFPPSDYLRSFYGRDLTWGQLLVERVRRLASRTR